ncbi:hypothetical protein M0R45_000490 [Rubus argutus]|uniref:Uncharacterized protein n=1 Tax=Rubus argutus TaxID=59490 RepID=A0AAW1VLF3_RUBAR
MLVAIPRRITHDRNSPCVAAVNIEAQPWALLKPVPTVLPTTLPSLTTSSAAALNPKSPALHPDVDRSTQRAHELLSSSAAVEALLPSHHRRRSPP